MPADDHPHAFREPWDLAQSYRRSPYAVLASAVGVGFVLGGGLFTRLTAKIVGLGLRLGVMAALPAVQKELLRRVIEGGPVEVTSDDPPAAP